MSERRESLTILETEINLLRSIFERELSKLVEDDGEMSDLLNFTVVMIQNGKTVSEMEKELDDIYGGEYSKRIGSLLVTYFAEKDSSAAEKNGVEKLNISDGTPRIKALKSTGIGNALTMSGALWATRECGRNGNVGGRDDRRKNAFDRLTTQEFRERLEKRRKNERCGRLFRGGRNDEGGRILGYRRVREDETDAEDFIPARRGVERGGRSYFDGRIARRGRFDRGGRRGRGKIYCRGQADDALNKRQRIVREDEDDNTDGATGKSEGVTTSSKKEEKNSSDQKVLEENGDTENTVQGHDGDNYFEGNGYGYGYGNYGSYHCEHYGGRGGRYSRYGRGRGRGRGRFNINGRVNRFGTGDGKNEENNDEKHENGNGTVGIVEESVVGVNSGEKNIANGTTLSYSGRNFCRGRGRGFYRAGRGRGGYRAHVANMIASKSWVRKKEDASDSFIIPRHNVDSDKASVATEAVPAAASTTGD